MAEFIGRTYEHLAELEFRNNNPKTAKYNQAAGQENYTSYKTRIGRKEVIRWQYDYRTEDGELFSCVGASLDSCRAKRDLWLSQLR